MNTCVYVCIIYISVCIYIYICVCLYILTEFMIDVPFGFSNKKCNLPIYIYKCAIRIKLYTCMHILISYKHIYACTRIH